MQNNVLLAVTGGIAAYKAADVVVELTARGCDVNVIMTKNACRFITPLTFEALSGNKVYTDTFDYSVDATIKHITLAQQADIMAIVPATANAMAKMAHGIADDMLSSTFLAATCPVLVAPAMNTHMYENAATQANMEILRSRSISFVGPAVGKLACGDVAKGVLAPVDEIVSAIMAGLAR